MSLQNPDAVLTGPVALERFQAVTRWRSRILDGGRGLNLLQLSHGDARGRTPPATLAALEQKPRFLRVSPRLSGEASSPFTSPSDI